MYSTYPRKLSIKNVGAIPASPLLLADFKAHARIDSSSEDAYLSTLLLASQSLLEKKLNRFITARDVEIHYPDFPRSNQEWLLDYWPINSIASIDYVDCAGIVQTLTPAEFQSELSGEAPRIKPLIYECWPMVSLSAITPVTVKANVGFQTLPEDLKLCFFHLCAHWFENREATSSLKIESVPLSFKFIYDRYNLSEGF